MHVQIKFQSLSGFWWGFCTACRVTPKCRAASGFNPFQGFGGVSASRVGRRPVFSFTSFNPFQGFGGVSAISVPGENSERR